MQNPQAVIEIGSTGIRLLVAEITETDSSQKTRTILDRSDLPVSVGRDVFTQGAISRETQAACIRILTRYAEQIAAWGISREETTVIGTSAVREAANRDPFVDRVKVKTGFTVRVIDGIEENRLMYIAVTDCLKEESLGMRQSDSIILEIAGGSTEMMLMEKGSMVGAHSMRLGTLIIEQQLYALTATRTDEQRFEDARRFLQEFIRNTKGTLNTELSLDRVQQFIAVGHDMNIAALFCGKSITPFLWEIQRPDFDGFVEDIQRYTMDEIIAKFRLSYSDAQTFQLSLLSYKEFVGLTNVHSIIVPETSIRDGIIISHMVDPNDNLRLAFDAQIIASATTLLKKYQGDVAHADYVRKVCLRIYDALQSELGMTVHERLLLEISAILHDIGMFIRAQDHNLHSHYIILHSEIFGLSREDTSLVAQIASYHRGSRMPQDDPQFKLQPRSHRLVILKLAAILRLADALDRSHQQKFSDFTISLAKDSITFRVNGYTNLSLEKLAIAEKGGMFENVFGYKIVLV